MSSSLSSPTQLFATWLKNFDNALTRGDFNAVTALFTGDCFWRDLVPFTWNITTMEGADEIHAMLAERLADVRPSGWQPDGEAHEADGIVEGWFTFETAQSHGRGIARLRDGRCWTLLTTMEALKGFEEAKGPTRLNGVVHGAIKQRQTWLEQKNREEAELGTVRQPYVVIIGGGQGGIVLAARLKQLNVPTIVLEKNDRPGDSWRKRYKSLVLHDPVWYDHLPYIPFPEHWPVFSPKDKLADWLEMYAKVMEINYWTRSEVRRASFDESTGTWLVEVDRQGETIELRPQQLVLATGMAGLPHVPDFPGQDIFAGEQLHSSRFTSGEPYAGKKCIVLGATNSAHDISAHLWENDADVTMIQRSSTHVIRSDTHLALRFEPLYSENALARGIDQDAADMLVAATPYKVLPAAAIEINKEVARRDADFYARLEAAGFLLDFGEDGSGLSLKYLRRGSGYYIDVGASELVAAGEIKLESRTNIQEIKPHSVLLTNGKELPADLIVYATGYGPMNEWAARLISPEVADKVGKCWGLGSDTKRDPGPWEGELRNMWKPTHQEALWFHGGNLAQNRFYSKFLALQLKARCEGLDTPVYGMGPVHHR